MLKSKVGLCSLRFGKGVGQIIEFSFDKVEKQQNRVARGICRVWAHHGESGSGASHDGKFGVRVFDVTCAFHGHADRASALALFNTF